jgi:hypothetical protein
VTRRELLHRARLLSSARAARFGNIPADAGKWWQQIETIAAEWDLPITWAEWHSVTVSRETPPQQDLL